MLLANQSTLMQCPVRFMAGTIASVEPTLRTNWNQAGKNRNQQYRDQGTIADELYGIAPGLYAGYTWLIPQRDGAMASHDNTVLGMTATGTLYGGVTASAPAAFDISTNIPDGQLVSTVQPGNAPATLGISTNTPSLTASISGVGNSTLGFSTNTPILGAIANLTADAPFGMSGTLTSYAIGIMEGTTAESGVTVDNVVNGVWNAVLSDYPDAGTAGLALATASSGGVDYTALGAAVWSSVSRTLTANPGLSASDVRIELGAELSAIVEVWRRHGLDIAAPLTQTTTSITAGDIDLAITGDPDVSVTVTRQP